MNRSHRVVTLVAQSLAAFLLGQFAISACATDLSLTADLGSTGLGMHLTTPMQPSLNGRFGLNYAKYKYNTSTSNVNYDFNLKLNTFDALLDYYPRDNPFRVSAGLVYNSNKIDATGLAAAGGTYLINGTIYNAASAGQINGTIEYRKLAPYLGIGWGNPFRREAGWGFSADAGILFQGSASTSLNNSGCSADAATCAQLSSDLAAENARLQDKADNLRLYPVVRIGASYRF
ncbi:MAG: hypothetical protein M3N23_09280 [Pseudomonadota bacterium]|nr:hypothetical protein [Pseudomonadota bacterium]